MAVTESPFNLYVSRSTPVAASQILIEPSSVADASSLLSDENVIA